MSTKIHFTVVPFASIKRFISSYIYHTLKTLLEYPLTVEIKKKKTKNKHLVFLQQSCSHVKTTYYLPCSVSLLMDHVGHCDPSSPALPLFLIRCTLALTATIIRHSCLNSTVALMISGSVRSNISLAHTISRGFACLLLHMLEPRRGNVCAWFKHRISNARPFDYRLTVFLESLFLKCSQELVGSTVPGCLQGHGGWWWWWESFGVYSALQKNTRGYHMHAMYNIFNTINVKLKCFCNVFYFALLSLMLH